MTSPTSGKSSSIELMSLGIYPRNQEKELDSLEVRTQQVVKKSFGEKVFDIIRAGIGEMPSGPLAVELYQYEQNSMMSHLGGHCHLLAHM